MSDRPSAKQRERVHEIVDSILDLYNPKVQIVTKANKKIMTIEADINDNNQMAKDIIDFYCDKAKFAEPKKYYVQLIKGDCYSYLNINPNGGAKLYNRLGLNGWKVKFTIDEVVAMNPKLLLFMEEVEK